MEKIIFISFYTEGYYEKIINKYLIPSLQKFNLPYQIYNKPNLHDWIKNGKQKFGIIYSHLLLNRENIVFLDADAEIMSMPELFYQIPDDYDIGVHYLDWWLFWHHKSKQSKRELLGATIYIKNNDKTKQLFKDLYEQTQKSNEWGQKTLQKLIESNSSIKVYNLPIAYCYIKKVEDNVYARCPVIIQHQVSRQIRNKKEIL